MIDVSCWGLTLKECHLSIFFILWNCTFSGGSTLVRGSLDEVLLNLKDAKTYGWIGSEK